MTIETLESRRLLSAVNDVALDIWSSDAQVGIAKHAEAVSYVPGEVIVATVRDAGSDAAVDLTPVFKQVGMPETASLPVLELEQDGALLELSSFAFGSGVDAMQLADKLAAHEAVLWASPNFVYDGPDPREFVPNDPSYGSQYHHELMGNDLAWDTTLGDSSIIIAVTDDGVEIDHEDLAANIWVNSDEIPGNGVDDDNNGYIDDVNGWDFSSNDSNPNPEDGDSHGTHVAGIAAGVTDNGIGIAGTAGGATIMPIRFYGSGSWTSTVISNSFRYAVDNGAQIINTSYNINGWVGNATVTAAFQYLHDNGVLHFNSAGNNEELNPARQAFHQTLLVASTTSSDARSSFSNYGTGIDLAAPGSSIRATLPNNGYGNKSGTSMAAPNAAGVAALIWSANPTWTRDQVAAALLYGGESIDAQNPSYVGLLGSGRVNSYNSISETIPAPQVEEVVVGPSLSPDTLTLRFDQLMDPATVNASSNYELIGAGDDGVFGNADDISYGLTTANYMVGSNDISLSTSQPLPGGRYRLTIQSDGLTNPFGTALDGDGNGTGGDHYVHDFEVVSITTTALPTAYVSQPYSFTLEAANGEAPYNWELAGDYIETSAGPGSTGGGVAQGWRADDASWLLNLPFSFPYYGENETSVYVGSNGFLDFDGASTDFSNTTSELIAGRRIAPLWDDLVTSSGDIYVDSSTSGEVTIRWDARTFTGSLPVDFAVTLYDDGRIRFDYGAAHTGLTPTIGVSGGADGYTLSTRDTDSSIPANVASEFAQPSGIGDLMLNTSTGEISGTPTTIGQYVVNVQVVDSQSNPSRAAESFTLDVLVAPPIVSGTTGDDDFRVVRNGGDFQVFEGTTLLDTFSLSETQAVQLDMLAGDDTVVLDFASGNPIPVGGIEMLGGGNTDAITVQGGTGAENVIVESGTITVNGQTVSLTDVEDIYVEGNGGADILATSTTVNVDPNLFAGALNIEAGGEVLTAAGGGTLELVGLTVATASTAPSDSLQTYLGSLDLADNFLVVRNGVESAVRDYIKSGYNNGAWTGMGIHSSLAADSSVHAVGYASNSVLGLSTFGGLSVTTSDILVRYTTYGDTNLSGSVDFTDLTGFINGYNGGGTGWAFGDFNYSDGNAGFDDLTLLIAGFYA